MKKIIILVAFLLVSVLLSSCDAAPGVPVQVASPVLSPLVQSVVSPVVTPSPIFTPAVSVSPPASAQTPDPSVEDEDDEDEDLPPTPRERIEELLAGALNMSDNAGRPLFFHDASTLTANRLLEFVYTVINDYGEAGDVPEDTGVVSAKVVKKIIRSAFGVDYTPRKGDRYGDLLRYKGGSFVFEGSDPQLLDASPYVMIRKSAGSLLVKFNIVKDVRPNIAYRGKGEALLEEDASSLFGYRLISLTKANEAAIAFTSAEASACLPADGIKTFFATNVIDSNDGTAWAASVGKQEWIMLSFGKPQDITGLVLHMGDWSSEDAFYEHDRSVSFRLDFSDGTSINDGFETIDFGGNPCIAFERVINTTYIKITFTFMDAADQGSNLYVSEIKPF